VDVADLPSYMRYSASRRSPPTRTLASVEAEYVRSVLASTGGNKAKAARILGIDRKTLREKLKSVLPS
jgi:DNA-binding NtrC family response regulator